MEETIHTSEGMSSWYKSRRLETNFPYLVPYLSTGLSVLDVGCGPGTVTLGVARKVTPGPVTGVDLEPALLATAESDAATAGVDNLRYVKADACRLPFAEGAFDLTYSRDFMHFAADPIRALREQRRVTKAGGTVMAFAVDWGSFLCYPELPAVRKVLSTWRHGADGSLPPPFLDQFVGRKLGSYFSRAGLRQTQVQGVFQPDYCAAFGSSTFEAWFPRFKIHFSPEGPGKFFYGALGERGLLQASDLAAALSEIEAWHENRDAFSAVGYFLAVGVV